MAGNCGSCTLCCNILGVPEVNKPINTWCQHCIKTGAGCQIYEARPQACREFECLWLQTQETENKLPEFLRPDKCKVMFSVNPSGDQIAVYTHPNHPFAYKAQGPSRIMAHFAQKGISVCIRTTNGVWYVDHATEQRVAVREVEMTEPDEKGVQYIKGFKHPKPGDKTFSYPGKEKGNDPQCR